MTADEFRASMARDASIRAPTTWTGAPAGDCPLKGDMEDLSLSDVQMKEFLAAAAAYLACANALVATTARTLPAAALTPHHEARDPLRRYRPVS